MKTIFIFAISRRWFGIARLPKALKEAGFNVVALCHEDSVLARTKYIDNLYTYTSNFSFQHQLKKIVKHQKIDLIVPGGDEEVIYLNRLIEKKPIIRLSSGFHRKLLAINHNEGKYKILGNKSELLKFAEQQNILTPNNRIINTTEDLKKELTSRNYPVVLKLDFGAAGTGVRICNTAEEAIQGFEELKSSEIMIKISLSGKIKHIIKTLLDLPLESIDQNLSIQNFVDGTPCMHGLFASKGEVLSSVTLLKIKCYPEKTGPSSVVKSIKHEQISSDVSKIIKELNYTGFASFDFIIDQNDKATLIECNPRPTPIAHISHLCGGNLCESIKLHFGMDADVNPYPELKEPIIALFPNELKRDAYSIYTVENYHDIPKDDPELLKFFNDDLIRRKIAPVIV